MNVIIFLRPVKYIAAVIYEDADSRLDEAVRIVIMAFIFVFDPMAILLLMAGNYTLMGRIGAAPKDSTPKPKPKEIIPNAKTEYVPAKVIAEVIAEVVAEKDAKAKSVEVPAEPTDNNNRPGPHGHGVHSPQFYKDEK